MKEIKFGASGTDSNFYKSGFKTTEQLADYALSLGLTCFEIPFGRGFYLNEDRLTSCREAFDKAGLERSLHAPYFINFANPDPEKITATFGYLQKTMDYALLLGATRVVFHPGSPLKLTREDAFAQMVDNLKRFKEEVVDLEKYKDIIVCPETMGKLNQMGNLEEISALCKLSPNFVPCIDFGHVNARYQGILKEKEDFKKILDYYTDELGAEKMEKLHVHFNKIEYTEKGEKKHLTFDDHTFGPEFEPFAECLIDLDMKPYIICESNDTQGIDALYMKNAYFALKK